jgi:hypothetical protein
MGMNSEANNDLIRIASVAAIGGILAIVDGSVLTFNVDRSDERVGLICGPNVESCNGTVYSLAGDPKALIRNLCNDYNEHHGLS